VPPGAGRRTDQAPVAKRPQEERGGRVRGVWAAPSHGLFSSEEGRRSLPAIARRRRPCRVAAVDRQPRLEAGAPRATLGRLVVVRPCHVRTAMRSATSRRRRGTARAMRRRTRGGTPPSSWKLLHA
jgi:hypothetical protein